VLQQMVHASTLSPRREHERREVGIVRIRIGEQLPERW
jgi:hypothetical protein